MQGCSPRALRAFAVIVPLALAGLLAGCKTEEPVKPVEDVERQLGPGECALKKLDASQWPDVGAAWRSRGPNLDAAVRQSIDWFGKPGSRKFFPFMQVCTGDQAAASVVAFQQILHDSKDEASFVGALKQHFDVWQTVGWNGKGGVRFTGYCTPEFKGSLKQTAEFKYPLYKRPDSLVTDPATGEPQGQRAADGSVKPWPARRQLEESGAFKGSELVWLSSPLDVYIIQVNGSAKILLPDGKPFFVGYAGKTGGKYASLGYGCRDAGLIPKDQSPSLRGIEMAYQKDPAKVQELIWRNENMVFFAAYEGDQWPAGSLGFKVTEKETLATDKQVYPRGGVVMVDTTIPELSGKTVPFRQFMLDQDTGGAIRAPGRADIYMGIGPAAKILAGDEVANGTLYYLFLKPESVSQFPMPAKKGGGDAKAADKPGDKAAGTKAKGKSQKGLKPPSDPNDANK